MRRHNSSGPRSNRRPSSSRPQSSGKGRSRRDSDKDSSSSFRKKSGERPESFRKEKKEGFSKRSGESKFSKGPRGKGDDFKKSDRSYGDKPFKARSSRGGAYGKSRDDSEKDFRKSGDKPFRASSSRSGSYGKSRGDSEGDFRKSERPRGDKPFRAGSSRGGSYGKSRGESEGDFRKSERPRGDKPFRAGSSRGGSYGKSRSESEGDFRKSERPRGDKPFKSSSPRGGKFGKPRGEEGDFKKSDRGDRPKPFKKSFDSEDRGGRKRKTFREKPEETFSSAPPVQTEKVRLNKYIANSGVCSRREADELITMGLISVNGTTITELGYKVNPGDEVRHEGKLLKAEKLVYILMNKPKGYLTTTSDPQERNTVMHIIGTAVKERIYPVGRLDRNTTGLLFLTNDGELAEKLMHPSYNVKKIYKVELDRPLTKADFEKISEGVQLEEGRAMVDDLAIVSDDGKTVGVELHIGWNRVVRRIFESLEYTVVKLDRSVYAGLNKKDLGRGEWRFLTKEEVVLLKHYK